jgi:hypothetical protein
VDPRRAVLLDWRGTLARHPPPGWWAAAHGIADRFDAWVLSFEHGIQKPDARMFTLALAALEVRSQVALMLGDRASMMEAPWWPGSPP